MHNKLNIIFLHSLLRKIHASSQNKGLCNGLCNDHQTGIQLQWCEAIKTNFPLDLPCCRLTRNRERGVLHSAREEKNEFPVQKVTEKRLILMVDFENGGTNNIAYAGDKDTDITPTPVIIMMFKIL